MRASRQVRWQQRQIQAGRCCSCGKVRTHYPTVCDVCAIKRRLSTRLRKGCLAHVVLGRGRRPKIADELLAS